MAGSSWRLIGMLTFLWVFLFTGSTPTLLAGDLSGNLARVYLPCIQKGLSTFWATFGGSQDDWASSLQTTSDGGFVIAGGTDSYGTKEAVWSCDNELGPSEQVVREILKEPEQRQVVREGREVVQSRIVLGGKLCLVRIFVDFDRIPSEIVTVYRTSKIEKYWRPNL